MAKEIEYKFLVKDLAAVAELTPLRYTAMVQGYLASNPALSTVRVRTAKHSDGNEEAFITVKGPKQRLTADEWEYSIPFEDATEMMKLSVGKFITKTRYYFDYQGLTIELDIFEGALDGLVIAEVEVESEDQVVNFPSWFGEEVTGDFRYTNAHLATKGL